jgi:hypothetical protein
MLWQSAVSLLDLPNSCFNPRGNQRRLPPRTKSGTGYPLTFSYSGDS